MTTQPEGSQKQQEMQVMPWFIPAGDDGLKLDCIMVAVMDGDEIRSISLHLAGAPPTL